MTADPPPPAPVFSPLHAVHVAANASFTDFAGWQMPVRYSGDLAEHHAVRTAAAIFDLSHMAELSIHGPDAAAFLDYALAGKLSAIALGQAKYSLLLAPSGGIIDDVVVYRTGESEFMVVANAGNHEVAFETLLERSAPFDVEVVDISDDLALIAVQGPRSREIVAATTALAFDVVKPGTVHTDTVHTDTLQVGTVQTDTAQVDTVQVDTPRSAPDARSLESLKYYWSLTAAYSGEPILVARTGYTGEDGFELYVPVRLAAELWRDLVTAGEPYGLIPAGLASRDTLRLEAGMPLYGHELSLDTLPAQAGLGRVPNLSKGDFVGRAALENAASAPTALGAETGGAPSAFVDEGETHSPSTPSRVLVGLVGDGKRAARAGYPLYADDTPGGTLDNAAGDTHDDPAPAPIGEITSGVLSPTLGVPIAMAYLDPAFAAEGTAVSVDVRGKRLPFRVTPLPFYSRKRA
ncbi:glycine cleavage system aminomethyltransferase GcvT [Subtercola lobariae]|uniref:Aminomethyltransferase n=1 Tax=Subtercola lobariae TaxID=1588641 RepID=A0A917B6A4_9MICO|nr:glycine cleavage system aminomethyltransferase GcvT [Subtercola lobariae]GGF26994.1 aminomethyltransferase [Subtercola lobariae]